MTVEQWFDSTDDGLQLLTAMVVKVDFATYSFFYLQKPFARLQASGFGN